MSYLLSSVEPVLYCDTLAPTVLSLAPSTWFSVCFFVWCVRFHDLLHRVVHSLSVRCTQQLHCSRLLFASFHYALVVSGSGSCIIFVTVTLTPTLQRDFVWTNPGESFRQNRHLHHSRSSGHVAYPAIVLPIGRLSHRLHAHGQSAKTTGL